MNNFLFSIEKWIIFVVLSLFAVFSLPQFPSPYVVPKLILLIIGVSLLVIIRVLKMITRGSLSFSLGKFDLGVLSISISYLLSTFLATPNKMEAFLFPGTTTFVLTGSVLYFLINQSDRKDKKIVGLALFISALLLSLSVLLTTLGLFNKIPQLPDFVKDSTFNPMGGSVPAGIYLAAILIFSIGLIFKERQNINKLFLGVACAVIVLALVILIGNSFPGKPNSPKFPNIKTSWEITVDTLKKSPILGIGSANYLTAFNRFRPLSYNQTDLWQARFTTASNHYFTILTETGFLGLFAWSIFLISIYRMFFGQKKESLEDTKNNLSKYSLVMLLIVFALLPASPTLMVPLFALSALFSNSEGKSMHLNIVSGDQGSFASSKIPLFITGLPFVVAIAMLIFFGSKFIRAEATYKQSLDALAKKEAKATYDLMTKAVNQNPKVDRYHASLAQVNMALASSLASKKDITDTDRATITNLVQQAISEGKATVTLNPSRANNWEILAQIYRAIMPFATGADKFAVQTYSQAIALDPINPNLRIALGGVYYALGNYDKAIDSFKLAVLAKPDLANAHYNLALSYREKKDYENAISEMNYVLSLVDKNSQDYTLALNTLEDIKKNLPSTETTQPQGNLQAPEALEKTNVKPPIELPKEATPPATQ